MIDSRVIMLPSSSKLKRQNIAEFDMISNMPDYVLAHILSFMPNTKHVVATSILSKRWRYVWTLVDKLVFYSGSNAKNVKSPPNLFSTFVDGVLKHHQGSIKDLMLSFCGNECTEVDVMSWITTAISKGVEKLDVSCVPRPKLPFYFFNCKTLVDLEIRFLDICNRDFPVAPFFPRLKKLHILHVRCDSESFNHIVSQCSVLEYLIVHICLSPLEIISSSLKHLELHSTLFNSSLENVNILLRVPYLEYILINTTLPSVLIVEEKLSSLVEANIEFKSLVDLKTGFLDICNMDSPFASSFPCLKKLHVQHVSCDSESFKQIVSQCSVLEHLIVHICLSPVDILSSSLKWLQLHSTQSNSLENVSILLRVPYLEYLLIDSILPSVLIVEEKLSSLVEANINFHDSSYLRDVNVKQFRDSFVRCIQVLSNVKVLRLKCQFGRFLNSVGDARFFNLTKLEIDSPFFEWRLLESFMESSINLQDITLKKTCTLKKYKLAWREPKYVPTCLWSSLRKLSIIGYSEDELPMVKYVLRNAQILERLDIDCAGCRVNDECKSYMRKNIQKLPRACARCKISLI